MGPRCLQLPEFFTPSPPSPEDADRLSNTNARETIHTLNLPRIETPLTGCSRALANEKRPYRTKQ